VFVCSPAVVANLWNVGDLDIDRYCSALLDLWSPTRVRLPPSSTTPTSDKPSDLAASATALSAFLALSPEKRAIGGVTDLVETVALARRNCNKRFLNGSAPVIYGFPL
jgi:hypothetical protein